MKTNLRSVFKMMTVAVLLMGTSLNVWAEDIVLRHEPGMDN